MSPALVAARAGVSRGWIEFKATLTTPGDLIAILITTGTLLAVMIWTRHSHVPGTAFSLGTATLVSVAPAVLRRMARRESGSTVAARREKVMRHA